MTSSAMNSSKFLTLRPFEKLLRTVEIGQLECGAEFRNATLPKRLQSELEEALYIFLDLSQLRDLRDLLLGLSRSPLAVDIPDRHHELNRALKTVQERATEVLSSSLPVSTEVMIEHVSYTLYLLTILRGST